MEKMLVDLFKNLKHATFVTSYHEVEDGKDWLCIDMETGWDYKYLTMEIGTFDLTPQEDIGKLIKYIERTFPDVSWDAEHFHNEGDTTYMFHWEIL